MIQKLKGIVLHHVKYRESSAVVYMYTDKYGRQAYLVNNIRGKKTKFHGNLLQPLTLLEIEAYHKDDREIQRLKEMLNHIPYRTISSDFEKSSQSLFLAEVLYRSLREEESNRDLYDFLEHSLQLLDVTEEGTENFHLLFLVRLTKFLGFYPEDNYSRENPAFDMRNGQFSSGTDDHPDFFDQKCSALLHQLLGSSFKDMNRLSFSHALRASFLENMMDYYSLHIHGFGSIKSLPVLVEIYREENDKKND